MVYGEGEPHAMDGIIKAARKRRMPIFNIPEMDAKLQLGYVGNVVQALELALNKEEATEGTFLIADKDVLTLRKFVEILYSELGCGKPPVIPEPLSKFLMIFPPFRRKAKDFFKNRAYDISRAVNILGYDPKVSTEEGLRRTIDHWKEKN
jgi:nucleoside-diphosphate-sugar epimerase